MPVFRYLDLSTGHLTANEFAHLEDGLGWIDGSTPRVVTHEYGAWVNVPEPNEDDAELRAACPNLAGCLDRARALDCNWINFDADADADEVLPIVRTR